jgi:hypothetical protein
MVGSLVGQGRRIKATSLPGLHMPGVTDTAPPLDSQQVELIGRSLMVGELLPDGLEVALPERDRGINLIVYVSQACCWPTWSGDGIRYCTTVHDGLVVHSGREGA